MVHLKNLINNIKDNSYQNLIFMKLKLCCQPNKTMELNNLETELSLVGETVQRDFHLNVFVF
jgi:hypothetical protein